MALRSYLQKVKIGTLVHRGRNVCAAFAVAAARGQGYSFIDKFHGYGHMYSGDDESYKNKVIMLVLWSYLW